MLPDIAERMHSTLSSGLRQLLDLVTTTASSHNIPLYVVGGFVRDLLLGRPHLDVDFVVEGDGIAFAQLLQERHGGKIETHIPFHTAKWFLNAEIARAVGANFAEWPSFVDIVTARRETYAHPGALPDVVPSVMHDDLYRRDFTINAMAIRLTPTVALLDPFGGQQDLQAGLIRVLHDKSFIDDATRIFRAVRFEQRFNFSIETHTHDLIPAALPTLKNISGERLRHEIDLIFKEAEPERALRRLDGLHVLSTIDEKLEFDEWCATKYKLARTAEMPLSEAKVSIPFVQTEVATETIYWIILGWHLPGVEEFARVLALSGDLTTALVESKRLAKVVPELSAKLKPSEVVARLEGRKPASTAVYQALWVLAPDERTQANIAAYVLQWQMVKPILTGDDLKEMGVKEGPALGKLLRALRRAKLDGEVTTLAEERAFIERLLAEGNEDDRS